MKILITYPKSFVSVNLIKILSKKFELLIDDIDYLNLSKTKKYIKTSKPDLIILQSPFSGGINLILKNQRI